MKKIVILSALVLFQACQNVRPVAKQAQAEVNATENHEAVATNAVVENKRNIEDQNIQHKEFCQKLDDTFKKYGWGDSKCMKRNWHSVRKSVKGMPLVWEVFGNEANIGKKNVDVTLLMCGVHGDEITPIKFCFDAMDHIEELTYREDLDNDGVLDEKIIIIAPIVNPDSFFIEKPTRTNARGVDPNRNFPTKDFRKMAIKEWMSTYRKDPRRFPGKDPMSEPEVVFQINLIKRYLPSKIISVHAPLTMIDYDGPIDEHTGGILGSRANELLITMSEQAKGYRIKDYPFFTGSLGNYAGNELNIPTYTLELPSSDARKSASYWSLFKGAIHSAIMHNLGNDVNVAMEPDNSSNTAN